MNKLLKRILKIVVIGIAVLFVLYALLHQKTNRVQPLPPPNVVVEKPVSIKIAEYIEQTGNTVAYNSVSLVARVEGYLESIHFVDGSFVKKDQLLFVIEPAPYMDRVREAQATLAAQKANLEYSKSEYERQQRMFKQNATSLNNVQKWQANTLANTAQVEQAQANLDIAKINYSYTHVLAPFDGRINRHLVDIGNLVGNGTATKLATLEQIAPLYVYFNLNELDFIRVRQFARDKAINPEDINSTPVFVAMQNETGFPHEGRMNFVSTGLNPSTGTITFRALLQNKGYPLLPGLFVKVRIAITEPISRLTVPDDAVLSDQIGSYVLTVNKDSVVVLKRVVTGSVEKGKVVILKGLDPEDKVIVQGLQFATPGNKVTIKDK